MHVYISKLGHHGLDKLWTNGHYFAEDILAASSSNKITGIDLSFTEVCSLGSNWQ